MGQLCFFNTAKAWGGGEKWHFEISGYLSSKGYDVFVIAHKKSALYKKLVQAKIPCLGIEISNLSFLNPIKRHRLISILRKHNFESIIMNLSRDVKIAGPAAKKAGIKKIIYRRGSAIPIKNTLLNRYLFKNVLTDILANSEATKKTVLENNKSLFRKNGIKVIHNGIYIHEQKNTLKSDSKDEFILLNLGRLEYQKNQSFLIHLAAELKHRKIPFKMLIGGEGSLRQELESLIKKLEVSENVILTGFIEDPMAFISQADIFLLPSFWEGFGYVLAEAALCKKPIIAFDVSSNPELIVNDQTGFLVPMGNLKRFTESIVELYQDKKKRLLFGQNGFEHIKENFDRATQMKKIEDYLMNG